jgi:hypothetical protein
MGGPTPELVTCVGCGGVVPDVDGATHDYLTASPGCWQLYGQWVAERTWSEPVDPIVVAHHVDCYALQHPGRLDQDRRRRQSVAVHLISLCRLLEFAEPPQEPSRTRTRIGRTVLTALALDDWPLLEPPAHLGATTIADVALATGDDLPAVFGRWVGDCWHAWSAHHPTVREWAHLMTRSG